MSKFEYVGRAGRFLGKSLPQICLKLKDFGVGRMFVRDTYKRYKGKVARSERHFSNLILELSFVTI